MENLRFSYGKVMKIEPLAKKWLSYRKSCNFGTSLSDVVQLCDYKVVLVA